MEGSAPSDAFLRSGKIFLSVLSMRTKGRFDFQIFKLKEAETQ
jgi:hypothetical protein